MLEEDGLWELDSNGSCSGHCTYDSDHDSDGDATVGSTMLPIFTSSGEKKKPTKKKGKGKKKTPAPRYKTLGGSSKLLVADLGPAQHQKRLVS